MASSKTSGCIVFPVLVLMSGIGAGIIRFFMPISMGTIFVMLLLLSSWIWGKINSDDQGKTSYRYLIYSVVMFGVFFVFRNFSFPTGIFPDHFSNISEKIYKEKRYENGDSITILSQNRSWKDNYGNRYTGIFSIREEDYYSNERSYLSHTRTYPNLSWSALYSYLIQLDTPKLDLILASLTQIKETKKLNQLEFAEMVVTLVQDIPYSYVFDIPCEAPERYDTSIRKVLQKCPECCLGDIPYGIQGPIGFMGNLKGDCDTRTVLIYAVLSYFGYDVVILNSEQYMHSIIGINLPATGSYKIYRGKRYYVWETTGKYFTLGMLPRNIDNMNHWTVTLTNP